MLQHSVRVDEIEIIGSQRIKVGAISAMHLNLKCATELFKRQLHHFVGHIHAVQLTEVSAHGAHQASRAAADFESPQRLDGNMPGEPREFFFQLAYDPAGSREELLLRLSPPAERHIVSNVLLGTRIPIRAHLLEDL